MNLEPESIPRFLTCEGKYFGYLTECSKHKGARRSVDGAGQYLDCRQFDKSQFKRNLSAEWEAKELKINGPHSAHSVSAQSLIYTNSCRLKKKLLIKNWFQQCHGNMAQMEILINSLFSLSQS